MSRNNNILADGKSSAHHNVSMCMCCLSENTIHELQVPKVILYLYHYYHFAFLSFYLYLLNHY